MIDSNAPKRRGRPTMYHTDEERKTAALVWCATYRIKNRELIRERANAWSFAHRDEVNRRQREKRRKLLLDDVPDQTLDSINQSVL